MKLIQPHLGSYRPDIDGLRAVAVLAVIVFHIDPDWLPGGFVGVDIFFVISGYLITGIIAKELEEGRFTIKTFYERRIRRILPALWAVLLVCIPVSWWLMLPADAEAMGKSALWSIVAMANVYFWRDVPTDYFAPQSAQMPFLHLWSLGVEEQFYVLWPLLLIALWSVWRMNARALGVALAVAIVASSAFLAEHLLASQHFRFAYYMLPTRAGELGLGAALSLAWPRLKQRFGVDSRFSDVIAFLGWSLLAASFLWLGEQSPFPGWRALLPTFGAALLIAAGLFRPDSGWLRPLRHPASVWLGRCSYSAYLWHWPILAWWRYLWGQPAFAEGIGILVSILAISGASQRWIEEPARLAPGRWQRTISLYLLLPATLLAAMALLIARGERWGIPLYPEEQRKKWEQLDLYTRPAHRFDWVCQQHVLDPKSLSDAKCEFGSGSGAAQAMLLGDSHASHFAPLIRHLAEAQGMRVRIAVMGTCAALPGPLAGVVGDERVEACQDGMRQILARAEDFPLLIVGGSWAYYTRRDPRVWERLEAHLRGLTERGHKVWLLPRAPELLGYDADCPAKQVRVGAWLRCPQSFSPADPTDATNRKLAEIAQRIPGVRFLVLHAGLCDSDECEATDANGHFIYADKSHLSIYGAMQLTTRLENEGRLPDLRTP